MSQAVSIASSENRAACADGLPAAAGLSRFAPTLADAVFVLILVRVMQLGASALFNDPGTGWHIRIGQESLAASAPTVESFSWTRAGEPFVATQFQGDEVLAAAYEWGGYAFVAFLWALCLAALFRWMYRASVEAGAWPFWAIVTTMLAASAASAQFLARPLLMTLVGIPVCYALGRRFLDGGLSCQRIALLPILSMIWIKIHPGVLGGVATVGLMAVGGVIDAIRLAAPSEKKLDHAGRSLVLLFVAALMGAATLLNPQGLDWHRWIWRLMQMRALSSLVDEWRPTDWTEPDAVSALLLLALLAVAHVLRREKPSAVIVLVTGFWLVQAIGSGRHVSILGLLVAMQAGPLLKDVRLRDGALFRWALRLPLFSNAVRARERQARREGVSPVVALAALAMLAFDPSGATLGLANAGPPPDRYSTGLIEHLRGNPPPQPVFNDINFGGQLILETPETPVFVDDRFEVYGDAFIVEYAAAVSEPDNHAEALLNRNGIQSVIIGARQPMARWLRHQSGWRAEYADPVAVVFVRTEAPPADGVESP